MSYDPAGGYTLFPSSLTRGEVIALTVKAMEVGPDEFEVGLSEDGFPRFAGEGYPLRKEEPLQRAVALLAEEECGVIEPKGIKARETYWFEPALGSYPTVIFWVSDATWWYKRQPEQVEDFVRRWLKLCEEGHALFGYISHFYHMFARERLEQEVFPAFEQGTFPKFLETIRASWLIYLGSKLVEQWREGQRPSPVPILLSEDMPSGAHFFRLSRDVTTSSASTWPLL